MKIVFFNQAVLNRDRGCGDGYRCTRVAAAVAHHDIVQDIVDAGGGKTQLVPVAARRAAGIRVTVGVTTHRVVF